MAIRAQWIGREKLMAELIAFAPEAEKRLADLQLKAAQDLAERIKPRAPARTGRYRRSLVGGRLDSVPGAKLIGGIRQTKDRNATGLFGSYLWRWLEFGTVKMPARPHIFPTYRARKPYIARSLRGTVRRAVKAKMKMFDVAA